MLVLICSTPQIKNFNLIFQESWNICIISKYSQQKICHGSHPSFPISIKGPYPQCNATTHQAKIQQYGSGPHSYGPVRIRIILLSLPHVSCIPRDVIQQYGSERYVEYPCGSCQAKWNRALFGILILIRAILRILRSPCSLVPRQLKLDCIHPDIVCQCLG